jgi:photosystem II stability/assembly factor-like uncharacterized protein
MGGHGGQSGSGGSGGAAGVSGKPEDPNAVGVWINVTPPGNFGDYGLGHVVVDPRNPSDLYISGGDRGTWKSSDYGRTWSKIHDIGGYYNIAIANEKQGPPTLWVDVGNDGQLAKSTDGGLTWRTVGNGGIGAALYSMVADPYTSAHLISGTHESSAIVESTDGGSTFRKASLPAGMMAGVSYYPFFIDTGDAATTGRRWLAIPQGSGGTWLTTDGGSSWTKVNSTVHGHGNAQIFQSGPAGAVFLPGVVGDTGDGVYRSADLGATWTRVDGSGKPQAIAWGTPRAVYSMWGWASGPNGNVAPFFQSAVQPASSGWTATPTPAAMTQGPNSVAVTKSGSQFIFVGAMWKAGLWRYVEP